MKNFAEKLADLIDDHISTLGSKLSKELRDEMISDFELQLMALRESAIEDDETDDE